MEPCTHYGLTPPCTNEILVAQALLQAEMGCDVISPSDMMDGRIGKIRKALDKNNFQNVNILSL